MMTYKNANIKSKKELAQRLLDGEVFYLKSGISRIYYDDNGVDSPFRAGDFTLASYWDKWAEMQIKTDWRDTVSPGNSVLCWVSDTDESKMVVAVPIIAPSTKVVYGRSIIGRFIDTDKMKWKYATPVTEDDIYHE